MAGVTRAQVRQRMRDIIAACTTLTMGTDITAAADLSAFPAYEVIISGAARSLGNQTKLNGLVYSGRVLVYCAVSSSPDIEKVIFPQIASAEAQLDTLGDWIAEHNTLNLSTKTPYALGELVTLEDNNVGVLDYRKTQYVGFILDFSVFVRH